MTLGIIGRLTGGRFKVPVQYFADVFAHSPLIKMSVRLQRCDVRESRTSFAPHLIGHLISSVSSRLRSTEM